MKTLLIFILTEICLAIAIANCATAQTPSQIAHPNTGAEKYIHSVAWDLYVSEKDAVWREYENKRKRIAEKCDAKRERALNRFKADDPVSYNIYSSALATGEQVKISGIEAILLESSEAFKKFSQSRDRSSDMYEKVHAKLFDKYTSKESVLYEQFANGLVVAQKAPY